MSRRHHVVIIGSGFGGLFAARAFDGQPVDVTLISKTGQHLFQPLLYQVATGILSEGEIAPVTREVLRRQKNVQIHLGEVTDIDLGQRTVHYRLFDKRMVMEYDSLIVAAGAGQSYFGNDEFARFAPGMKSIDDALEIRGRIFGAFELAELSREESDIDRLTTFVVVGAGPTGVEMAGQIAELAYRALPSEFHNFDTRASKVILVDGADRVLGSFGEKLSAKARRALERLGVDVRLESKVVDVDTGGLLIERADGTRYRIEASCKVWAAGVQASPLAGILAAQSGAKLDRAGRIEVEPDLTIRDHPEVFVVGDMMALDGLPGVSPVAIQGGRHAAKIIAERVSRPGFTERFQYVDKGSMATISRFSAIASIGPIRTAGFFAWLLWLAVHLWYIIGFKQRLTTLLHWVVSFVGNGRAERAVTTQQVIARGAIADHGPGYDPLAGAD
ncbi:NAD(P)/FAD-dependent oxidoreductase [Blastococcus sp. Marseille-P5729]|uniref:NAD(P)/FAD-dependent oxidoreductase n=1 Tax=Blastococcus sp. Marseille-P5729 TaxID=2086582 RepID=UPI000D0FB1E5|nr:NAD(P)/FAD-dependent oxidoreductase [Blastococcus sp. Marseille-P5729]